MAKLPRIEAEDFFKDWEISYVKLPDGTFLVRDLNLTALSGRSGDWIELPDFSKVNVAGNFKCDGLGLISLKGAPASVGGDFICKDNKLTSLEGAPASVGGHFICNGNQLTSLKGAPSSVGGDFICNGNVLSDGNQLTSLKGGPSFVGGDFICHFNKLKSLEGAPISIARDFLCYGNELSSLKGGPRSVGGKIDCFDNPLTSLADAPRVFKELISDFNASKFVFMKKSFSSWEDIPENLRRPSNTEKPNSEPQATASNNRTRNPLSKLLHRGPS
jgi:hypothetical protein